MPRRRIALRVLNSRRKTRVSTGQHTGWRPRGALNSVAKRKDPCPCWEPIPGRPARTSVSTLSYSDSSISLICIPILSSHLRIDLPSGHFSHRFSEHNFVWISLFHVCYMSCQSHPSIWQP